MKICAYLFQTSIKTYVHCFAGTVPKLWNLIMESYINCEPEKNHNKRTLPSLGTKLTSTRWPAPFYADQERTISKSAQPRLRDKMNPNYHHSDYFDESYQKNWTQAGQIRSSNLQHHSSVHTPFSDQPSPSSGLLTPYSRVPRPYVPQPPAYQYNPTENPSHYGPYYGAPPGTCNFSGYYSTRAPLPSAAGKKNHYIVLCVKKMNNVP